MCGPALWNSLPNYLRDPAVDTRTFPGNILKTFMSVSQGKVKVKKLLGGVSWRVGVVNLALLRGRLKRWSTFSGKKVHSTRENPGYDIKTVYRYKVEHRHRVA